MVCHMVTASSEDVGNASEVAVPDAENGVEAGSVVAAVAAVRLFGEGAKYNRDLLHLPFLVVPNLPSLRPVC